VFGARCRFNSHLSCDLPFISKIISTRETEPALNFFIKVHELYNAFLNFAYLSGKKETKLTAKQIAEEAEIRMAKIKKIRILSKMAKKDLKNLTDQEIDNLAKMQIVIDARETIEIDQVHEPVELELTGKSKPEIGPPPTLTKFEKARIIGARALQLSQGAPPFITIPDGVTASFDLAVAELEKFVIPITIRRVLPNGDFQNIPLEYFN